MEMTFIAPDNLNRETADLVARFAQTLAGKLRVAEVRYGYSTEWKLGHWRDECAYKLREHVEKGDPLDVAAYCAFMWHHGWGTSPLRDQPR